jgi:hypothetical protein
MERPTQKFNMVEGEFEQLMQEIDQQLTAEGVKLSAFQLLGWVYFCRRQKLEGINLSHPLSVKVMDWFSAKYGDRLAMGLTFGRTVVIIGGDLLELECPFFWGSFYCVCPASLFGQQHPDINVRTPGVMNVLDKVKGMTQVYANGLTSQQCDHLLAAFVTSEIHLGLIIDAGAQPFVTEARTDIAEAVDHITRVTPNYGASKWASLQAVEKFLKAFVVQHGGTQKHIHVLDTLATDAEALGLPRIERTKLNAVQCLPKVRYDASLVVRNEAVAAYSAAIDICANVSLYLTGRAEDITAVIIQGEITFENGPKVRAIQIGRGKPQ